jgi:5-oxopent-3-ene-1,2,5-tricarboxylate decarboxylase/2-hydroxyhepta-2,4-diene-1,7-dioate isomerase
MNPSPPPFLPDGTVYGTLLNFRHELALWAARAAEPPYKAPPQAPVLFIKTANTFSPHGAAIMLPTSVPEVEIGASIGLVIGFSEGFESFPSADRSQPAMNNEAAATLPGVVGCVLLNDLSIPHDSYYRPPVKFKCLDGFLGIGPRCVPLAQAGNVNTLKLEVRVNGALCQTVDFHTLVRDAATLLADVNAFMTLQPGDLLMLGSDCLPDGTRPRARVGDRIEISAPGFEALVNTLVQEAA